MRQRHVCGRVGSAPLKVGSENEVILAAYDYDGNFLSIHAVGARPVIIDVCSHNWNLDPDKLAAAAGPATRAVIVSHLHGGVVPMREVMEVARHKGLHVIEDAAQMPGALIQGRKAGTWGDVGVLSFGGSKLLTAGRGGALLTCQPGVRQRARLWMNRGNQVCPLSELQAAVLLPQLDYLDARNAVRTRNVRLLTDSLRDIPGIQPFINKDESRRTKDEPDRLLDSSFILRPSSFEETSPGYYKLGFQYDDARFGLPRSRFVDAIRAEGIAMDEGFRCFHVGRSPHRFRQAGVLTEADKAHRGAIVLHHPVLLGTPTDLEEIAIAVRKVYGNVAHLSRNNEPTGERPA